MPIHSPIFRKLLLSAVLLILGTVVILDFYLTRYISGREVETAEKVLEAQARILAGELAPASPDGIRDWCKFSALRAQSRVTVIGSGGVVLADSEHDPATMENHSGRPEIRDAFAGRRGQAIRHSATTGRDLLYFAIPVSISGQSGSVLRLAMPLRELDESIAEVRWRIFRGSLIAALIALMAAYFVSRSFTKRIRRVQSFAEGLVNDRFSEMLAPGPDDEIGSLARSLNDMAGQLRDLVDRLRLESARREAILSSMVEGVLAVDGELCVTFCNEAFARAVGSGFPVPERLPLLELVRDPEFLNLLTSTLVSGEPRKQRLQLAAADGRSFEIQTALLEAHGRRGAISVLHDVTELERLERVRKDFVANVSHEMRTPLAAIQGYAETLLDSALEDRDNNRRFVEIIKAHAARLNSISADLLVLSELESGQPAPEPQRISVRHLVKSALDSVEAEARLRDVTIHADAMPDEFITGQQLRMEQALVNLLDNAVKFNRQGGAVWVRVERTADGRVRVEIEDNGIGIPSEDLPRIFERFYRVDKARSREVGGTGLGLAIVKHIVERMHGKLDAESQLGKGSKFVLTFPGL